MLADHGRPARYLQLRRARHTLVVMLTLMEAVVAGDAAGGPCVTAATTLTPSGYAIGVRIRTTRHALMVMLTLTEAVMA